MTLDFDHEYEAKASFLVLRDLLDKHLVERLTNAAAIEWRNTPTFEVYAPDESRPKWRAMMYTRYSVHHDLTFAFSESTEQAAA